LSLDEHIKKFGKEFVSIPVNKPKYWDDMGMYIANVMVGTEKHPFNSSIAFEFFDHLSNGTYLAYKPLDCYRKNE
jgi:hypothetical protein